MTDQEMTPDKETLRPCPFCGEFNIRLQVGVGCRNDFCSAQGPMFSDKDIGLDKWNSAYCWKELDSFRAENEKLKLALNKICSVTQFDHPTSQIIGSEEYEGAWLDCVEIAKEALACSK